MMFPAGSQTTVFGSREGLDRTGREMVRGAVMLVTATNRSSKGCGGKVTVILAESRAARNLDPFVFLM